MSRGDAERGQQGYDQVAALHQTCFPGYYLTRLGPSFLEAMYAWYVSSPEAIAYVALNQSARAVGFVAGTTRAEGYHRSLFRHQAGPLVSALAGRLISHPLLTLGQIWERKDLLPQALSSLLSPASGSSVDSAPPPVTGPPAASLVSIGVEPSQRRSGIARRLTELFLRKAAERGSQLVTLSVREDNLGARGFYESLNWVEVSRSSEEYHGSLSITYQKNTSEEDESG